uniref:Putative RNA-binding protein 15B n=1 Tax=Lygus hesperus TaxID=30085 RepID=A0A0A9YV17_LYGHE
MAHRSKVELSGQYIGKFQCKIGYGKATPTTRIWVGGLGTWTSLSQLEREFDRFGAIKKIDYIKGDTQAYILYDSIDAATAAVKEMRGFPLGGPEHKLRCDFADVNPVPPMKPKPLPGEDIGSEYRPRDAYPYPDPHYEWAESEYYRNYRGGGGSRGGWEGPRRGGRGGFRGYPTRNGDGLKNMKDTRGPLSTDHLTAAKTLTSSIPSGLWLTWLNARPRFGTEL